MAILPAIPLYQSREGYYAINNPFQTNGPKGFNEFKTLENGDMFVRMDLPGATHEGSHAFIHSSKRAVVINTFAERYAYDFLPRYYTTITRLTCNCCEISSFTYLISEGVLRLVISKTSINTPREDQRGPCTQRFIRGSDPNDPSLTGRVLQPHPCVTEGSVMAYESKQVQNGKLYVRVDMPGVTKENFTAFIENGRVKVTGQAPAISHDSGGRLYSGYVAILSTPIDNLPLKMAAKCGVFRLLLGPA